ncbi:MAG: hypothetical protein KGI63_03655 [Xanthomonadaceae bacterium]|nr:hypothetical protein [Xanthomonadaceae bacterium]
MLGLRHSLTDRTRQTPWFYVVFGLLVLGAASMVLSGIGVMRLCLATGVVSALLLLPAVLGLLYTIALRVPPAAQRVRGT